MNSAASSTVTLPALSRAALAAWLRGLLPRLARQRTFLDEGMHQAADLLEFADEIARQVNDVRR